MILNHIIIMEEKKSRIPKEEKTKDNFGSKKPRKP